MKQQQFTFTSDRVLFFGRTIAEYKLMFNLDLKKLKNKTVLDCPSGPASFVAQANEMGIKACGIDPIYANDFSKLKLIVEKDLHECIDMQDNIKELLSSNRDIAKYKQEKEKAISLFLKDFKNDLTNKRYINAQLPNLPFEDNSFDLVLSSNFLFLYSDYQYGGMLTNSPFDYEFHFKAIKELIRVTKNEIRIYPIRGPHLENQEHEFLKSIKQDLSNHQFNLVKNSYTDLFGSLYYLQILKK